ncbi:outer membrane protein transport protein [Pseudoalteromonas prydzensis]|uniref:outer membrane protein transport protein n=1 Tax=Pseudoalteromonas prydzensis TaxID=182141 RepID=UPI0007E51D8B|nr:outer membrane protein transport protein [Pseudoalteromonas prydzensis]MBE0376335.1 long-chain fatty acid transport protein [Pseudoalteromonas prydzensis ACAM 620]
MKFTKTLIAASLAVMSADTFAAAFQLAEQNASGLGRAYAGEAAVADDASVVARNPALMSVFKEQQLSVAGIAVVPDVSLRGTEASNASVNPGQLNDSSIAPAAFVPAGYFVMPIDDKFAVGFGAFSNFGLATEFDADYPAGQLAGETEIVTVNMNVSGSYKINEQFSVGLGLNYIYADAKIIRNFGANPLGLPAQTQAVHLEGDDYGFGWNIGASYQLDENSRFGFNYRSETDITFDGEYSNQLPVQVGGLAGASVPGSVEITLPAIAEFSGTHQLDEKTGLHYSVMWTGWDSFEKLEAHVAGSDAPVFSKDENFSNAMRYSIGGDYQFNDAVLLRAGIAYDESPADKNHMSISIPDTDRFWYSFGVNYTMSEQANLDIGMSILRGKTQNFTESDGLGQQWGFESKGHAYLFGAQYNYTF